MKSVTVNTSTPYDVLIEKGCLSRCGEFAAKLFVPQKSTAAIITDDRVSSLYLKTVSDSFQKAGFSVCSFVFPNGEDSKSHDTLLQVYDFLIQNNITGRLHRQNLYRKLRMCLLNPGLYLLRLNHSEPALSASDCDFLFHN